ncbi:MAG: hypothetical protein M3507_02510 [Actinomycetota bacterium]|nr:hypothetical protein [Actinomycetota bacterium]
MSDAEFEEAADDAVRLAVEAQVRAGADVLTDGEQRRDNYASFVGGLLENCQLIPVTDLLPYVDDPEEFERELAALDVPAGQVRHPAVFGPLGRGRSLTVHEADFVRRLSDKPVKVSLPGPYLLTRTMWMECISDRAYPDREALATDIVRVLREEAHFLLAAGVALVQSTNPCSPRSSTARPARAVARSCAEPSANGGEPRRSWPSPGTSSRRWCGGCLPSGWPCTCAGATGPPTSAWPSPVTTGRWWGCSRRWTSER